MACNLRSEERRKDPSCLGSSFVGSLATNPPSSCWVVGVMKCCTQACCSAVLVDWSTVSNALKRSRLCSRLLSFCSRSACCGSFCIVAVTRDRPESVKRKTVSCRTGQVSGCVRLPDQSISYKESAPISRSMLIGNFLESYSRLFGHTRKNGRA